MVKLDKFLILGSSGQLGSEFLKLLPVNYTYAPLSKELDVTNQKALAAYCSDKKDIRVIINCTAQNEVDNLENNPQEAEELNVTAVKNLSILAKELDAIFIHFSTDYVFDGLKNTPYLETDETKPVSVYGKSKLAGEKAALAFANTAVCFRVSWLYSNTQRKNFFNTIKNLGVKREVLNIVFDQIGTPTYVKDVAEAVSQIIPKIKEGQKEIYHLSNEGVCSWYDFAFKIKDLLGLSCEILPIHSYEYKTLATRPSYSVLDKTKIKNDFNIKIRHWEEALKDCVNNP